LPHPREGGFVRGSLSVLFILALSSCHKDALPTGPAAGPGRLAFVTLRNGGQYDIYLMNPNGTGVAQLTAGTADDATPAWSPNGQRIAFFSNRSTFLGDTQPDFNIWVVNADGSGTPTQLTSDPGNEISPAWSPDGASIAFATNRDSGDFEIYVMDALGANAVRLTRAAGQDGQPAWSPDGQTIAFASTRGAVADTADIYSMSSADGSGVTNLTNTPGATELMPAWSPDGTKIAFASDRSGDFQIWVMKANGDSAVQLTHSTAPAEFPDWSPDGTRIAYDADGHIWIMYADGSQPTRVTSKTVDGQPRWKP
jgi:Tol biopolymer transport system component